VGIRFTTAGNPNLKAEESESYSVGMVLQPTFIPEQFGRFTVTVDRWQIKQEGIVGTWVRPTSPSRTTWRAWAARATPT
jgi:iron complex outermembrane receptor protein